MGPTGRVLQYAGKTVDEHIEYILHCSGDDPEQAIVIMERLIASVVRDRECALEDALAHFRALLLELGHDDSDPKEYLKQWREEYERRRLHEDVSIFGARFRIGQISVAEEQAIYLCATSLVEAGDRDRGTVLKIREAIDRHGELQAFETDVSERLENTRRISDVYLREYSRKHASGLASVSVAKTVLTARSDPPANNTESEGQSGGGSVPRAAQQPFHADDAKSRLVVRVANKPHAKNNLRILIDGGYIDRGNSTADEIYACHFAGASDAVDSGFRIRWVKPATELACAIKLIGILPNAADDVLPHFEDRDGQLFNHQTYMKNRSIADTLPQWEKLKEILELPQ